MIVVRRDEMRMPLLLVIFSWLAMSQAYAKSPAPLTVKGAQTISTIQAKSLKNQGVTFIDVRRASDFQTSHIPWSIHLDLKLDLTEASLLNVVSKNQAVVFYCNGDQCQRSALASEKAVSWGWKKVLYYRGGFPDWKASGLAIQ